VIEKTGVIDQKDAEHWVYNNGHKVSKQEAFEIAKQLKHLISTGDVKKYALEVEKEMKQAEKQNVRVHKLQQKLEKIVAKKLGKEDVPPCEYPVHYQKRMEKLFFLQDFNDRYPFSVDNVKEFIKFCEKSEGFEIC
jgi:isopentenyl phosphate kinase